MWIVVLFAALVALLGLLLRHEPRRAAADSDEFWPLQARPLLTEREQALYQRLNGLYPQYRVMVQLALSQLLEVRADAADPLGVRNHFNQLTADFALCDAHFNVAAVIELDDGFHRQPHRQYADTRKERALRSAGVRLVRIPAGPLPDAQQLRHSIDAVLDAVVMNDSRPSRSSPARSRSQPSLLQTVAAELLWKIGGGAAVLVAFWMLYARVIEPAVMKSVQAIPTAAAQRAQTAAARPANPDTALVVARPAKPQSRPPTSVLSDAQLAELQQQLEQQQARTALAQRKAAAWAAFYQAPAACDEPANWSEQVECGNRYIRAQREFEKQWSAQQPSAP
ncbi:MAG: DUF2726 domain-containing protein [Steroidobacteraceae bacterium]